MTSPFPESKTPSFTRSLPVLMLASDDQGPMGCRSGYTRLSEYIPGAKLIHAVRRSHRSSFRRVVDGCLSRFAASRWFRLSSLSLEWRAWCELRHGFSGVVHSLWGDRDFGFLDRFGSSVRKVCTFHACDDSLGDIFRSGRPFRRLDSIVLVSHTQVEFFNRLGVTNNRIHVVLHGVDTKYFRPVVRHTFVDRPFVVLSVGSYRRRFDVLRAVAEHLKTVPNIKFEVIGPARLKEEFSDLSNVVIRSSLTDSELLEAYQRSDCLVMTVENATANNAVVEAMSCGLPVIAEAVGGIPEYVPTGAGIVVRPGDSAALAGAIVGLAESPIEWAILSRGARIWAEELDWSNVGLRMESVYYGSGDAIEKHIRSKVTVS